MGWILSFRRRQWMRSGATIARILAIPLIVFSVSGWIPSNNLDLEPKGPWPWGAIIGLTLIGAGLAGIFLPRKSRSEL